MIVNDEFPQLIFVKAMQHDTATFKLLAVTSIN